MNESKARPVAHGWSVFGVIFVFRYWQNDSLVTEECQVAADIIFMSPPPYLFLMCMKVFLTTGFQTSAFLFCF